MGREIAKKAVLVYPKFEVDTFWSLHRTLMRYVPKNEFRRPKRTLPPLGLMGLYSHIRPYYEKVVLIDRNIDPRPLDSIIRDADHVYIGGMLAQEAGFLEDAKKIKQEKKVLIAGGTVVDERSPLMKIADHLVENEAEMVMDDLLKGLAGGTAEKFYRGTPAPPERFFKPDFSSINMKNYASMSLQISRGCPENCEFCDITTRFGRTPRITPWEHTEASLRQMHELGWRNPIFVVDDNFIGNPKRAIEALKKIYRLEEELGYHFPKYTELTMRLSNKSQLMEELREWLCKTNFTMHFIGVETNNIASLIETGKRQNLQGEGSIEERLLFISERTGASVTMGMIHGFDNDTAQSVDSQTEFINNTHAPVVMLGLLTALPHTALWRRLKKEGRLIGESSGNNSDGTINFIPYNFSAKQAELDYVRIMKGIYDKKAFFNRVMRELSVLNPEAPQNTMHIDEAAYSAMRILTQKNAATFWRYLPRAHRIAKKRFGFNTPKYRYTIGMYLAHCAKFTHFRGQTECLEEQLRQKTYEPWQLYSWREIQESQVASIDVLEADKGIPSPLLQEKIKMRLENGYEFIGTRLEALSQFVGPYLREGMKELKSRKIPSPEGFWDIGLKAYLKTHFIRPQILGNLELPKAEEHLREILRNQADYLTEMQSLFRRVMATGLEGAYPV